MIGEHTEVIPKRDLLGVPVALTDYERTMKAMDEMVERRLPGYVCAIPVHSVMVARHDAELRAALRGATLNVPDGKPLVWALSLLGHRLPDRVYGPDLMAMYCKRSAERGHRVWLYGGHDPEALAHLADALRACSSSLDDIGGNGNGGTHQQEQSRRRVGRPRRAEAGEVDGPDASAPGGSGIGRRRCSFRLPCRAQKAGASLDAATRPRMGVPAFARAGPALPQVCATQPGFRPRLPATVRRRAKEVRSGSGGLRLRARCSLTQEDG